MNVPEKRKQEIQLQTFRRLFATEDDCIEYLYPLRWPDGFICPFCRTRQPHLAPQRYITCPHCGNRSSLTSGTLMHGAKKPVRDWLQAIWWFSDSQFDTSAKELQRLLNVSCYQTAWTWLQKLRRAMGQADTNRCQGVVEICCAPVIPARQRKESALVLIAAEIVLPLSITGRIHMQHIVRLNEKTLERFLEVAVRKNSSLLVADAALLDLLTGVSSYYASLAPTDHPLRTEELSQSFTTCLHTVHRGGVTVKHLQLYLDEFCFRNNAALLSDHQSVFRALLSGVIGTHSDSLHRNHRSGQAIKAIKRWT